MKNIKILLLALVVFMFILPVFAQGDASGSKPPVPPPIQQPGPNTLVQLTRLISPIKSAAWIVEHGKYLYYLDSCYAGIGDKTKIHRMDKNGENKVGLEGTKAQDGILIIKLYKDKIYYLRYIDTTAPTLVKTTLYSYDIATDKEVKLTDKNVNNYVFKDNWIYFTTFGDTFKEGKLYKMKINGSDASLIADLKTPMSLQIADNKLYLGYDDTILIMNFDGTDRKTIPLKHYAFTVHGGSVYYLKSSDNITSNEDSYLWRYNLVTKKDDQLIGERVKQFIVAKDKIYFYNYQHHLSQADINGQNIRNMGPGSDPVVLNGVLYYYNIGGKPNIEKRPSKSDGEVSSDPFPNVGGKVSAKPGQMPDRRSTFEDYYHSWVFAAQASMRYLVDEFYAICNFLSKALSVDRVKMEKEASEFSLPIIVEGENTPENIARQNAAGNRLMGGYIVEKYEFLYFANSEDNGRLYRMDKNGENKVKLGKREAIENIQVYKNKLYYTQKHHTSLYSFNLKNNRERKIANRVGDYVIDGNFVYFTGCDNTFGLFDSNDVYRMKPNGSNKKLIADLGYKYSGSRIQIYGNKIFINDSQGNFMVMNLDGSEKRERVEVKGEASYWSEALVYGGSTYYHYINSSIHRGDLNDPFDKEKPAIKDSVESYNIVNDKLYYCDWDDKEKVHKIYKSDLDGKDAEAITKGHDPIIINGVMYYYNNRESMKMNGTFIPKKLLWMAI